MEDGILTRFLLKDLDILQENAGWLGEQQPCGRNTCLEYFSFFPLKHPKRIEYDNITLIL